MLTLASAYMDNSLPMKTIEWVSDSVFSQMTQMPREGGMCFVNYNPFADEPLKIGSPNSVRCITNSHFYGTFFCWLVIFVVGRQVYLQFKN